MNKLKGSPSSKSVKIGTITLTEAETFRNQSYETASWWTECRCEPQTVDLYSNGYYVMFGFEGVRTDEHFVNRIGAHSSLAEKRELGNADRHGFCMYDYSFCDGVKLGKLPYKVEFDEGYDIMENFVADRDDRPSKTFYCIGKAA